MFHSVLFYSYFNLITFCCHLCVSDEKTKDVVVLICICNIFDRLVGRAAFTGNHLWILSENYAGETHPSEVYYRMAS